MLEDDLVMVVRRVYQARSAPRIAILMPKEQKDEEGTLHQVLILWIVLRSFLKSLLTYLNWGLDKMEVMCSFVLQQF